MELGGDDIILNTSKHSREHVRSAVIACVTAQWPDALIEWQDVFVAFVYENPEALLSWSAEGATPENLDSMIYVLISDEETTLVVDGPNTSKLAKAIEAWLKAQEHDA